MSAFPFPADPLLRERFNPPSVAVQEIVDSVWKQRDYFVRWPAGSLLFKPGCVRIKGFHEYTVEQSEMIQAKGIEIDKRSNGPAIMAYKLAGGQRPKRHDGAHEWSVHHIYDGKFPWTPGSLTLHAVKHGDHFTEAAGLVAIHRVADALADEVPYFAWLLRAEANSRFGYDPDGVFRPKADA